jgi:hypothetical protein
VRQPAQQRLSWALVFSGGWGMRSQESWA